MPLPVPVCVPPASRRQFLSQSAALLLGSTASARLAAQNSPASSGRPIGSDTAGAQPTPEQLAAQFIKPETEKAIERGLAWLAAKQNDDGAFGGSGYGQNVAVVSL